MGDVDIFRAELNGASSALSVAMTELLTQAAELQTEDVGIENPASRVALRLEMHRRLTALRAASSARIEGASQLAAAAQGIADRFHELEDELTGRRTP
ncbi:hypothetical protein [Microbacterium abyssi]|uniref:hypothetical protein n=1 Tax=Microbacterium abyssi TaxID=2782166 RepID=UPI001886DF20|nr:hypothetical protein [Microbacterium sp. A18JL241]